jgi:hypothetical protein
MLDELTDTEAKVDIVYIVTPQREPAERHGVGHGQRPMRAMSQW